MKWNELKRMLEKKGWYLYRSGSRHDIYRHPDKPDQIAVGRHGSEEVKKGTEKSIKKVAGL